jgi:hypothetical protein
MHCLLRCLLSIKFYYHVILSSFKVSNLSKAIKITS